jgi:two-component system, OmpR family, sensor kinase
MKIKPGPGGRAKLGIKLRRGGRGKLRTRVLAGVLAITLAALAAFDFAAVTLLRGYLIGQTDARLRAVLNLYQPLSRTAPRVLGASAPVQAAVRAARGRARRACLAQHEPGRECAIPERFNGPVVSLPPALLEYLVGTAYIQGPRGSFLVSTGGSADLKPVLPADLRALAASGSGQTVISVSGNDPLRLMARDFPGTGVVYATTSLIPLDNTVGRIELILILGSAAAGLLAAGGTAWLMRRGLRPVERMAAQADKITAGDLTGRVGRVGPQDAGTEVGRLGAALNGMLARIEDFVAEREASQQATSRFFADASHELRTPLASLRANAELYQQGALTRRDQVDEAMRRIVAEAKRMGRLVDDMLRLARLDQRPERQHDWIDLTGLIGECAERARTAHPGHVWRTRVAPGLATVGDEELLRQAVDNLLANVAAHTRDGTVATIAAARRGATVTVEVSDDGPGVPEDQLPHIFDRFYRGGAPSAHSGSGLGLAIVAATAAAHHGDVQAVLNHPHGLCVLLSLPAAGLPREDPPQEDQLQEDPARENRLPTQSVDASLRPG